MEQAAEMLRRDCSKENQDKIASKLLQENDKKGQTIKMAMAIIVNALVFHITIAKTSKSKKVKNIQELKNSIGSLKNNISEEWNEISSQINYRPIYDLAVDVLEPIGDSDAEGILNSLIDVATDIAVMGTTSQHDFGGQLFQKLINDRKFLASYYTLPSSAAFLAELAVSRMTVDWTDANVLTGLRVGDFACGTGALLSAVYNAMRSRHRHSGNDDSKIHKEMMENVFVGLDIMPAATHLTTSVMSSAHPEVIFRKTDIATMLYGVHMIKEKGNNPETCIGSLDLIADQDALPLFATGHDHYSGTEGKKRVPVNARHETFDLVIMNPPFKRPCSNEGNDKNSDIPNPAFRGFGTSKEEQEKMGARREKIYSDRSKKYLDREKKSGNPWYRGKKDLAGEGRAGLATWFMDLADVKVKEGGVVALILPATFTNGEFWKKARTLLLNRYRDILVVNITSSDAKGTAFSDDTGMGECIVVATRKFDNDKSNQEFVSVSIDNRPISILEAVHLARAVVTGMKGRIDGRLNIGTQKFGRISHFDSGFSEGGFGGIQDDAVEHSALMLKNGILNLPRSDNDRSLPIINLLELGYRTQDAKYVNGKWIPKTKEWWGPFDTNKIDRESSSDHIEYPILWGHSAKSGHESCMVVKPDSEGTPRKGCEDRAKKYWKKYATRLFFNRDFRLTSQSLAACMTPKKVIGGSGWSAFICDNESWNEPLVLWMNTTLGLISFWFKGTRQHQGRSRVHLGPLETLPVYDVRKLSPQQMKTAKNVFKEFSCRELLPANHANKDPVRQDLDEAVLLDVFGLPRTIMEPLSVLREKWCREPSLQKSKSKNGKSAK